MSKRKTKSITVGKSESVCKQCGKELYIKKHAKISEKQMRQAQYFTQWDYCPNCNKVYFDEKYRVLTPKGQIFEELNKQNEHIRSI